MKHLLKCLFNRTVINKTDAALALIALALGLAFDVLGICCTNWILPLFGALFLMCGVTGWLENSIENKHLKIK